MQVQDSAPRLLLVGHFRFLIKVPRAEPVSDRCALRPLYCTVGLLYGQCFSGVLGFASNPPRGRGARGFAALLDENCEGVDRCKWPCACGARCAVEPWGAGVRRSALWRPVRGSSRRCLSGDGCRAAGAAGAIIALPRLLKSGGVICAGFDS